MTLSALAFAVRFPWQANNLDDWVVPTPAALPATPPHETLPETPPATPPALETGSIERFREFIQQFNYQPEEQAIESSPSPASISYRLQAEALQRLENLFTDSEDDADDEDEIDNQDAEQEMEIDDSKMQKIKQPWAFHPRMEYALSLYSDDIVTIDQALPHRTYRCSKCRCKMHVVNGLERRKHFRHQRDAACKGSSPESYSHYTAKKRLSEILENQMKIVVKRVTIDLSNSNSAVYSSETLTKEEGETVVLEYRDPNGVWRADLAVLRSDGSLKFIVEILYTHATGENVRPEPWYEVEAEEVLRANVLDEENLVLQEKRAWKSAKRVLEFTRSLRSI